MRDESAMALPQVPPPMNTQPAKVQGPAYRKPFGLAWNLGLAGLTFV
jgi:hypothetical protein